LSRCDVSREKCALSNVGSAIKFVRVLALPFFDSPLQQLIAVTKRLFQTACPICKEPSP
jgi:hypothetical protein